MGRIDLGCIREDEADESLWYGAGGAATIDRGFGFLQAGSGPCALGDGTFRTSFEEASVVSGDGDYLYPRPWCTF